MQQGSADGHAIAFLCKPSTAHPHACFHCFLCCASMEQLCKASASAPSNSAAHVDAWGSSNRPLQVLPSFLAAALQQHSMTSRSLPPVPHGCCIADQTDNDCSFIAAPLLLCLVMCIVCCSHLAVRYPRGLQVHLKGPSSFLTASPGAVLYFAFLFLQLNPIPTCGWRWRLLVCGEPQCLPARCWWRACPACRHGNMYMPA